MSKTIHIFGFPRSVSAEEMTNFLENYTGKGTVLALKIRQFKRGGNNRKAYSIVQFITDESSELMLSIINERLNYQSYELKVRKMDHDIIHKPRETMLTLKNIALSFGCQTSENKFHVFEKVANVVVDFEVFLRKVDFFLTYCDVMYKLELSYDSMWQIYERHPGSHTAKFLIIQIIAAPKIYKKCSSGHQYEDSNLNYFKDNTAEGNWVRTTDFTASSCIGQCTSICLELQPNCKLDCIREYFLHYYKESSSEFVAENGSTFSQNLLHGPTVNSPDGLELPFAIYFRVNSLVQNGYLAGPTLDAAFFKLVHPQYTPTPINLIECALEKLYHIKDCCYDPVRWLNEQYATFSKSRKFQRQYVITLDDGLVYVRRVQVTPTKAYYCGPEAIVSNRVLRNFREYIDNFIRVSFVDEDGDKMRSCDLLTNKRHTTLYDRVLSTLSDGIVIGTKKFDFLAFSSSQLKESSTWMFSSKDEITASHIRDWMGDFKDIRNVAKHAARLGQSFGSSTETFVVDMDEIEIIPDIESRWKEKHYVFSDGIGKISSEFAARVTQKCRTIDSTPSAFQIRYGGYKGVVAVDPTSAMKLSLRKSMSKYTSSNNKLDVLHWSKIQRCFLNRQIITLLSTLGVSDDIFEKKQREAVHNLDMILTDPVKAYETLQIMASKHSVVLLKEMLSCGYKPDKEPFLSMMLQAFRELKLMELRNKARIFVQHGRTLMGCMDETRTLKYGQVFVQVSQIHIESFNLHTPFRQNDNRSESDKCNYICESKVVVAKNPCLHPGDVRVLQAVNVPSLHHMVDCVVFPQKGKRPHPNECSGSDLDGDLYFVSWDSELIPPCQASPMDYSPAPNDLLDHDVKIEEIQEYFTNYILNDSLGKISDAHTAFADKEPKKAKSQACIELAKLFSIAVDFPKTGVPAVIPPHLHVKAFPDFMERQPTYESKSVLGKLFREVKDIPETSCIKSFTRDVAIEFYDHDMEVHGFKNFLGDAQYYKGEYDFKLGNLMDYYEIKTEAEIFCGSIMKLKKSFNSRKDMEAIGRAVSSLKKEARTWFGEKSITSGTQNGDVYAKASAWYHVTYHPNYWGRFNEGMKREHFLSFPWCISEKLIHIKTNKYMREIPIY